MTWLWIMDTLMPEIKDGRSSTPRRGPLAWIEGLEPSCFTFVMATGIVSEAFALSSQELLANGLFTVNLIAYPCLFAASIVRVLCFPRAVWVNLTDRRRVFGFFAFIVGTNVIGAGSALRGFGDAAFWLWVADSGLWLILIYLAFAYSACPLRPTPQALSEAAGFSPSSRPSRLSSLVRAPRQQTVNRAPLYF